MISCKKYIKNSCSFTGDKCWYVHKEEEQAHDTENLVEMSGEKNEEGKTETRQKAPVFWEAPSNLTPPTNPNHSPNQLGSRWCP